VNWRSPKLLRTAREAPYCFHCHRQNRGKVFAAHSNQQRDGKGRGIKAHDFRIAYICDDCHTIVDLGLIEGVSVRLNRAERQAIWEEAHRATIGWLIETGRLVVA